MKALLRRYLPQWVRRTLVEVCFLPCLNGIAILSFGVGGSSKGIATIGLIGVLVAATLGMVLYGVSSHADFRPAQLDERQQSVRLQAMSDSYRIVCILLVLAHLVCGLQIVYGHILGPRRSLASPPTLLFLPFVMLLPNLAQALVAWRELDLPESPDRMSHS